MTFEEITTTAALHFMLIFCRIGSALMLVSGIGEIYIPIRIRLCLAGSISLLLLPTLQPVLPPDVRTVLPLFLMIVPEIMVGLMIGGITRILQSILHIAGMIIAFQSSLASALLFDASQGSQGSVAGNFLTLIGVTLIFVTDTHHQIITALAHSYSLFPAGQFPPVNEFADFASKTLSDGFAIAFALSSPLIVFGLLLYLGAGLLGRLMPNMQVFFVMMPLQVYVGFIILALTLSSFMLFYIQHYEEVIGELFSR